MNNVAMNLVATMMQNTFSNSYTTSVNGASQESFTSVLTNSKNTAYDKPVDQSAKLSNVNNGNGRIEHTKENSNNDPVATKQEDLQKLNRNKEPNETISNDKPTKVEGKEVSSTEKEVTNELSKVEEELVSELANQLNVDPEEIKELLMELELTVLDLFDMENLQMFMTESLGASNPMELIVTDGASEKLRDVMETLDSALSANPELAKEVSNMTNGQGENVEANEAEFAKMMDTIQNQSTNNGQNPEQSGGDDKSMAEPAKLSQSANAETSQNASGFEGMLNQVVTQKTETIIMNGSIQTIQTEVTAKDVFDQIVTGMKVQVSEAKSNVTLQLNPHNLGKIALNLTSENGSITGHFVAESEAVKEVIEANISILKNQLASQGIEIEDIKITVGSSASFFTGQEDRENAANKNFKNKGNKRSKIGNINEILADKLSEDMIASDKEAIHENSSIELHA